MSENVSLKEIQKEWPQTLKLYVTGFICCFVLTGASFLLTLGVAWPKTWLMALLIFLAVVQAFAQLVFFMHLGKEAKPRWMLLVFYFMVLVLLIVVLGSLWIMTDLNERMMGMPL